MSQAIQYIFECIVKLFLITVGNGEGIEVSVADAIVGLISAFVGILAIIRVVVAINWAVYKAYRFIHERKKKRLKNKARPVREQARMLEPHE